MNYSTITLSADIENADGTKFDGYLVFLAVPPAEKQVSAGFGKLQSKVLTLAKTNPPKLAPLWHILPVRDGKLDNSSRVWKTSAYAPKGTQYKLFLFDKGDNLIEGSTGLPGDPFSITTDTYQLTVSTIADTSTEGVVSDPELVWKKLLELNGKELYVTTGLGGYVKIFNDRVTVGQLDSPVDYTYDYVVQADGNILIVEFIVGGAGSTLTFTSNFINPVDALPENVGDRLVEIFRSNGTAWVRASWS